MALGPFDLTGGPFLQLYGTLFALAGVASLLIPPWLRPEGRDGPLRDPDALAWLAGGPPRVADATAARLLAGGALTMREKDSFSVERREAGRSDAERAALMLPAPIGWSDLRRTLQRAASVSEDRLLASGLIMTTAETRQLRVWQTLPLLLLLPFGAIKWEVGTLRDRPVGYLTALLLATAVAALIRFATVNRRTRAGDRALAAARAGAGRLRRAPMPGEVDLAVALFGTAVLAASPWAAFHQLRTAGDGGSSGSDGGGCGGGGGGGGGCGGCGG